MSDLTDRERQVLDLVARGNTTKQIAGGLGVSDATVAFHINNARRKLGASNRSEAVAIALKRGLIYRHDQ